MTGMCRLYQGLDIVLIQEAGTQPVEQLSYCKSRYCCVETALISRCSTVSCCNSQLPTHRWTYSLGDPVTNQDKTSNKKKQKADSEWGEAEAGESRRSRNSGRPFEGCAGRRPRERSERVFVESGPWRHFVEVEVFGTAQKNGRIVQTSS
jgi:hypothetical protein